MLLKRKKGDRLSGGSSCRSGHRPRNGQRGTAGAARQAHHSGHRQSFGDHARKSKKTVRGLATAPWPWPFPACLSTWLLSARLYRVGTGQRLETSGTKSPCWKRSNATCAHACQAWMVNRDAGAAHAGETGTVFKLGSWVESAKLKATNAWSVAKALNRSSAIASWFPPAVALFAEIGLESVGLETDRRGFIAVDENFQRLSKVSMPSAI